MVLFQNVCLFYASFMQEVPWVQNIRNSESFKFCLSKNFRFVTWLQNIEVEKMLSVSCLVFSQLFHHYFMSILFVFFSFLMLSALEIKMAR